MQGSSAGLRFIVSLIVLVGLCSLSAAGAPAGRNSTKPVLTIVGAGVCNGTESPVNSTDFAINMGVAYAFLIRYDGHGYAPEVATSWKVRGDNKAITMTLRQNARYSDGTRVTASTVKDWIEYRLSLTGAFTIANSGVPPLHSIDVLGKYVLRVVFQSPNPLIVGYFSNEVGFAGPLGRIMSPKAIAVVRASPNNTLLTNHTFGTGPYVLDPNQTITGDHCTYLPNKYYWDKSKIKWSKVVFKKITDPGALVSTMASGQAAVGFFGSATTVNAAKAAGLQVIVTRNLVFDGFNFWDHGAVQPALADARVRQALNYAIDRKAIATALFGQYATPTSNPFPSSLPYDPKIDQYYRYNPSKAKALLVAAGYGQGFTIKASSLGDVFAPLYKTDDIAQACVKYFAAIGVTLKLDIPTSQAEFTRAVNSKTYSLVAAPFGGIPVPTKQFLQRLRPGATVNDQHGWHDPKIDKLWVRALRSGVEGSAPYIQATRQLVLRAVTNALFIPVVAEAELTYVNLKQVKGVTHSAEDAFELVDWSPAK